MSIMIREYFGFSDFSPNSGTTPVSLTEGLQDLDPVSPNSLFVEIEGIHVGPTRNFTRYMKEALKSSMKSWTYPYKKPLIKHHNEKDGDIIGRIDQVEYRTKGTLSGTDALLFRVNVPGREDADQVKDGRLLTTSIGVIAHDIRCSCCGYQILDESGCPDHTRGGIYDGEYCYWDIYEMEAKELSYVVVPSDIYAKNVKIYDKKESIKLTESSQGMGGKQKMDEKKIQELQESLETLQKENEDMAASLKEANEAKDTLTAEKESLTAELAEAKEKVEKIEAQLQEKTSELEEEVALREAAESQAIELKEAAKKELVDSYSTLRYLSGMAELSEAAISTRSEESLRDSIHDLKLELSEKASKQPIVPPVIIDPTITESKDKNVKKEKAASNIDLEEGLQNLFNNTASHFIRK